MIVGHFYQFIDDRSYLSNRYMRPDTLHFVLTPQAAICHGGHFYAMSTIKDTIFGMYHMLTLSSFIMNTEHTQPLRLLLQWLIVHIHQLVIVGQADFRFAEFPDPHVPDMSTLAGTSDLFLLCIFAELGELLDPTAYAKKH